MVFAGHCGLKLELEIKDSIIEFLLNEELGAVIQVANKDIAFTQEYLVKELGLSTKIIGCPTIDHKISILNDSSLPAINLELD